MNLSTLSLILFIAFSFSCSRSDKSSKNNKNPVNNVVVSNSLIDENETVDDVNFTQVLVFDFNNKQFNSSNLTSSTVSSSVTLYYMNNVEVASIKEDAHGISLALYFPKESLVDLQISGTINSSISVYNNEKMKISLVNANITSSDGPAINIQSPKKTFIVLSGVNALTDSSLYSIRYLPNGSEMDLKATLFAEGALNFSGSGNLSIVGKKKHSLVSDEHIIIHGGNLSITANKKDAIRSSTAFVMQGGSANIQTLANAGKGIKVEGKEDSLYPNGYIKINNGNITINSYDKAITASWETAEDSKTTSTSDDPIPYVEINGGNLNLTTFGIPVDSTGSDKLSPEGIESKGNLEINGGNIVVNSTDDSLNSIKTITINGGNIYCISSHNDALDSNENFYMNGGIAILHGAPFPESGLDVDEGVFSNNGGIIIATGGWNSTPDDSVSSINAVLISDQTPNLIMIKDQIGNLVFAYDNNRSANSLFISSPVLLNSTSYNLFNEGSVDSFTSIFNGLYLGNLTSSSGSLIRSFSTEGRLSNLN